MSDIKEESDSEEDRSSIEMPLKFAVVTLQDTDEVMVAASEWLNTDKTKCQWPPFRSAEKLMQAVRNRIEPSAVWEPLNIHFHAEYDTCEEAINKQEELIQAQKYGLYAAITLQESKELTVVPTSWLNEQKTQCYWPPFKSPEKFLEAIKNRHEPERGEKPWEMLNIVFHKAYATYEEAKEKHETFSDQKEQFSEKLQRHIPKPKMISQSTQSIGQPSLRTQHGCPRVQCVCHVGARINKNIKRELFTTQVSSRTHSRGPRPQNTPLEDQNFISNTVDSPESYPWFSNTTSPYKW